MTITDYLWETTLDGMHDEEAGNVDEVGFWYGLFRGPLAATPFPELETMAGAIVWVDEQGFKDSKIYIDAEALEVAWGTVLETTEG